MVVDHQPMIGDGDHQRRPRPAADRGEVPLGQHAGGDRGRRRSARRRSGPACPDVDIDTTIFRPATFIEMSIDNLTMACSSAACLVHGDLFAFLYEWRVALISCTAMPLSLMAAVLVLYLRGTTINTMILAGFVIALGVVVDDAIIDIENVVRRLRQHRREGEHGSPMARIILEASLEVRSAIVYATLIEVPGDHAGLLHGGPVRRLLPAAGDLVRVGTAGVDGRGPDRDAGDGPAPAVATRRSAQRESPIVRWLHARL